MSVREIREKLGMERREFADYFKISVRTVQDWEQKRRTPPPHVMFMINRILELEDLCRKNGVDCERK